MEGIKCALLVTLLMSTTAEILQIPHTDIVLQVYRVGNGLDPMVYEPSEEGKVGTANRMSTPLVHDLIARKRLARDIGDLPSSDPAGESKNQAVISGNESGNQAVISGNDSENQAVISGNESENEAVISGNESENQAVISENEATHSPHQQAEPELSGIQQADPNTGTQMGTVNIVGQLLETTPKIIEIATQHHDDKAEPPTASSERVIWSMGDLPNSGDHVATMSEPPSISHSFINTDVMIWDDNVSVPKDLPVANGVPVADDVTVANSAPVADGMPLVNGISVGIVPKVRQDSVSPTVAPLQGSRKKTGTIVGLGIIFLIIAVASVVCFMRRTSDEYHVVKTFEG